MLMSNINNDYIFQETHVNVKKQLFYKFFYIKVDNKGNIKIYKTHKGYLKFLCYNKNKNIVIRLKRKNAIKCKN